MMTQATMAGNVNEVRRLLDSGTPVAEIGKFNDSVSNRKGQSIHAAAAHGKLDILKLLLEKGADKDALSVWRKTPLTLAIANSQKEVMRYLLGIGADLNRGRYYSLPLYRAVDLEDAALVREFIERGAKVDAKEYGGWTPLLNAVRGGNIEITRILLEAGADMMKVAKGESWYGQPTGRPLVWARKYGKTEIAELLVEAEEEVKLRKELTKKARRAALERQIAQEVAGTLPLIRPVTRSARKKSNAHLPPPVSPNFRSREQSDDFALVIGISEYSELPDAQFADRDGMAVVAHMEALGVPRRNIIHLKNSKAGYSSLKKYLESWLPRNVKSNSRVYFYFSGHGAPDVDNGDAYLIPWDGDPNFLKDTAYPLKRLYKNLSALKAKEVIVALDACFSGAGGRSVLAKGARPLVTKVNMSQSSNGRLTLFAAASSTQITTTLEDKGHGIFTYYFLKGLSRSGTTAKSLYEYLKPKVQDEARRQNREQTPTLYTPAGSDPILR